MNRILYSTLALGAAFLLGGAAAYAYWAWHFYTLITTTPEWIQPVSRELSSDEREIVESAVRYWMREPSSAQFQWPQLAIRTPLWRYNVPYCFTVNGRNALGGYTGPRAAFVTLRLSSESRVVAAILESIEGQDSGVRKKCREVGYAG